MFRAGVVIALMLLVGPVPSGAQMELGVMTGAVTDDAGKPLEGATVRLRDLERGRETIFRRVTVLSAGGHDEALAFIRFLTTAPARQVFLATGAR